MTTPRTVPSTPKPAATRPERRRPQTPHPQARHHRGDGAGDTPTYPESRLVVSTWPDPVLDNLGHDPRSPYVERFWLSVLGPSATLLLRRLAAAMEASPDGFELDPLQWAQELGLGTKGGRHSPFWRSIDRTCRFGAAHRNGEQLAVRRRLAPLSARQVDRLPDHLRVAHDAWTAERLHQPRRRTVTTWTHAAPAVGDRAVSDDQ